MSARLPDPFLTRVYRLEAPLDEPLDLGGLAQGRRRIVPLTGGTFTGPELNGKLLGVRSLSLPISLSVMLSIGMTSRAAVAPVLEGLVNWRRRIAAKLARYAAT